MIKFRTLNIQEGDVVLFCDGRGTAGGDLTLIISIVGERICHRQIETFGKWIVEKEKRTTERSVFNHWVRMHCDISALEPRDIVRLKQEGLVDFHEFEQEG